MSPLKKKKNNKNLKKIFSLFAIKLHCTNYLLYDFILMVFDIFTLSLMQYTCVPSKTLFMKETC